MRARLPSFCSAARPAQTVHLLGFSKRLLFLLPQPIVTPSGSTYIASVSGKARGAKPSNETRLRGDSPVPFAISAARTCRVPARWENGMGSSCVVLARLTQ